MTQRVVIVGPNLSDQSKGSFHVHAEGCADLRRNHNLRYEDHGHVIDATSLCHVAESVYDNGIMQDDETGLDYLSDFHIAPCVQLPRKD